MLEIFIFVLKFLSPDRGQSISQAQLSWAKLRTLRGVKKLVADLSSSDFQTLQKYSLCHSTCLLMQISIPASSENQMN